jgi:hypothetical protein
MANDCIITPSALSMHTAGRAFTNPLLSPTINQTLRNSKSQPVPILTLQTRTVRYYIKAFTHLCLSQSSNLQLQNTVQTATISFLRHFFTRAPSPATMSATKTKVQSIIDENPVAVFSKSYCPYCNAAKKLLSESGAKFYAIELDQVGTYKSMG